MGCHVAGAVYRESMHQAAYKVNDAKNWARLIGWQLAICLVFFGAGVTTGCHGRKAPAQGSPVIHNGNEDRRVVQGDEAASKRGDYQSFEEAVIRILHDSGVAVSIAENEHIEVGFAKRLSGKILKSPTGLVIVMGKVTGWEGRVPDSGVEFQRDGKAIGFHANNMTADRAGGDAICCWFTYGEIPRSVKADLLTVIKGIE